MQSIKDLFAGALKSLQELISKVAKYPQNQLIMIN